MTCPICASAPRELYGSGEPLHVLVHPTREDGAVNAVLTVGLMTQQRRGLIPADKRVTVEANKRGTHQAWSIPQEELDKAVEQTVPNGRQVRRTIAGMDCMVSQRRSVLEDSRVLTTWVVQSGPYIVVCDTDGHRDDLAETHARAAWDNCDRTATAVAAIVKQANADHVTISTTKLDDLLDEVNELRAAAPPATTGWSEIGGVA